MPDTGIGRRNAPPPSAWKRQPSLSSHTPWPETAPEESRQCLPVPQDPDAPPPASDREDPEQLDFDAAIASW